MRPATASWVTGASGFGRSASWALAGQGVQPRAGAAQQPRANSPM